MQKPHLIRVLAVLTSLFAAVAHSDARADGRASLTATGEAWPEADVLFHRDPAWLGGDDAYSLDLGSGRVVWFFGDSFVAPTLPGERRSSTMVHNSVGIQTGYDPTIADFKAYWQEIDGKPASFFPDDGHHYFWPGGSILIDGKLLVFFMQSWTKDPTNAMGFDTDGWAAMLVENPADAPDRWQLRRLDAPQNSFDVLVGSASLLRDGEYLVAFSVGDKEHGVFLVRWPWSEAAAGNLTNPEWWVSSERGWVPQAELAEPPAAIMQKGQTEFTVVESSEGPGYLLFQFDDFPVTPIGLRTSPALTGPWSHVAAFLTPEKLITPSPGLMLYAAKAHPEQICDGLALTYASNTHKLEQLLESSTIYYPRFVRVTLQQQPR